MRYRMKAGPIYTEGGRLAEGLDAIADYCEQSRVRSINIITDRMRDMEKREDEILFYLMSIHRIIEASWHAMPRWFDGIDEVSEELERIRRHREQLSGELESAWEEEFDEDEPLIEP